MWWGVGGSVCGVYGGGGGWAGRQAGRVVRLRAAAGAGARALACTAQCDMSDTALMPDTEQPIVMLSESVAWSG